MIKTGNWRFLVASCVGRPNDVKEEQPSPANDGKNCWRANTITELQHKPMSEFHTKILIMYKKKLLLFLVSSCRKLWSHTGQTRISNGFRNTEPQSKFPGSYKKSVLNSYEILVMKMNGLNSCSLVEYKCVERIPVLRTNRSSAKEVV